jgi:hypothetical protein
VIKIQFFLLCVVVSFSCVHQSVCVLNWFLVVGLISLVARLRSIGVSNTKQMEEEDNSLPTVLSSSFNRLGFMLIVDVG